MKNDIEEYKYSDHSNIHFVYDEDSDTKNEKKAETSSAWEAPGKEGRPAAGEKERRTLPYSLLLAAMGVLIFSLCLLLWRDRYKDGEEAENTPSQTSTDISIGEGDVQGHQTKGVMLMRQFLEELYPDRRVLTLEGYDDCAPETCIILDLGGADEQPEALLLTRDEDGIYTIVTYVNTNRELDVLSAEEVTYSLTRDMSSMTEISRIVVNQHLEEQYVDLILEGYASGGKPVSAFLRCEQSLTASKRLRWKFKGEAEGHLASFSSLLEDQEDSAGGEYCLYMYDDILGCQLQTSWDITAEGMYSGYEYMGGIYWKEADLQDRSWLMKRPVAAYGESAEANDPIDLYNPIQLLQGRSLRILGVLKGGNTTYYHVETDQGDAGYILLKQGAYSSSCQMVLQDLPMEEVLAEAEAAFPVEDEWLLGSVVYLEEAYTPVLPRYQEPFSEELSVEGLIASSTPYAFWIDLDGDGVDEKVCVNILDAFAPLSVEWYINDEQVEQYRCNTDVLNLVVTDLNPEDSYMDIGFNADSGEKSYYRYEGGRIIYLGMEDVMHFGAEPHLEDMESTEGSDMAWVPVRGAIGNHSFQYEIQVNIKTGRFSIPQTVECIFDTPVSAGTLGDVAMYSLSDEEITMPGGTPMQLVSMFAERSWEESFSAYITAYYGLFLLEDGTYVKSQGYDHYDDYKSMGEDFDLTALFPPEIVDLETMKQDKVSCPHPASSSRLSSL